MPFWWRRRRKPWFGTWRRNYRTTYRRRRRRPRRPRRRRHRRTYRRRRRRYRKVRRKFKKIPLAQWQPESIRKCKIKGTGTIVLGAQGTQMRCYTTYKNEWTNPRNPTGGGFGVELFTLKYLYDQYTYHQNIWTTSNAYYELCRYTGCAITLYRHPETDFIFCYDNQPPFDINKYTYMFCHPLMLMQRKHKKFLLSAATKLNGRIKKRVKIRPPKQLVNKWMFQEDFSKFGLVTLIVSACNLRYPDLTPKNENLLISLTYLQTDFYKESTWANSSKIYKPYSTIPGSMTFKYYDDRNQLQSYTMTNHSDYANSVSPTNGWFCKQVLKAVQVFNHDVQQAMTPCGTVRYNPLTDSGRGNKMWLTSILTGTYNIPKDEDLIMEDYPLWLMLYGYTSFLKQTKQDQSYFSAYCLVIKTDAVYRTSGISTSGYYVFLDKNFVNFRGPNNTEPTLTAQHYWYPSLKTQLEAINDIVSTGPYIPKYGDIVNSTWQCNYNYDFYFKWGGSQQPDATAENPAKKGKYPVPDNQQEGLQIEDPDNQKIQTILRTWDYRRGSITKKALKRMYEHLETDDSLSTDSESSTSPKKKKLLPTLQDPKKESKKIKSCLQTLCEESTCQAPQEDPNLLQLIQQQHQQQQQLKHNLLTLITDLKHKQKTLLHQTGMLF
nr:MAG: ORF1 [Torque teno midi virus]UHM27423.1 MAG: ORF1 [Torque teno midi virus]